MITIGIKGTEVPALGFGTYKLRGAECTSAILTALDTGYRHIDTAQIYENEDAVGDALKQTGVAREDIFLTTKVWMSNVGPDALQASVDESLKKLKTDYIDLLLIHWPTEAVPFKDQMIGLLETQEAQKAKLIGVSNFTVRQMKTVVEDLGVGIACNQVEYHPFLAQTPVLNYAHSHGMFVTAYSPLARGQVRDEKILQEIGLKYSKSPGQITLRWLLQQGGVAAIPKAGSASHIEDNFDIFDFELASEDMLAISALARPDGRMINPDWAPAWDRAA